MVQFFCSWNQKDTLPARRAPESDWRPAHCAYLVHLAAGSTLHLSDLSSGKVFPFEAGTGFQQYSDIYCLHPHLPIAPSGTSIQWKFGSCQRDPILLSFSNAILSLVLFIFAYFLCLTYYEMRFFLWWGQISWLIPYFFTISFSLALSCRTQPSVLYRSSLRLLKKKDSLVDLYTKHNIEYQCIANKSMHDIPCGITHRTT